MPASISRFGGGDRRLSRDGRHGHARIDQQHGGAGRVLADIDDDLLRRIIAGGLAEYCLDVREALLGGDRLPPARTASPLTSETSRPRGHTSQPMAPPTTSTRTAAAAIAHQGNFFGGAGASLGGATAKATAGPSAKSVSGAASEVARRRKPWLPAGTGGRTLTATVTASVPPASMSSSISSGDVGGAPASANHSARAPSSGATRMRAVWRRVDALRSVQVRLPGLRAAFGSREARVWTGNRQIRSSAIEPLWSGQAFRSIGSAPGTASRFRRPAHQER